MELLTVVEGLAERRAFPKQGDAIVAATELLAEGFLACVRKDEAATPARRWVLEAWAPRNGVREEERLREDQGPTLLEEGIAAAADSL